MSSNPLPYEELSSPRYAASYERFSHSQPPAASSGLRFFDALGLRSPSHATHTADALFDHSSHAPQTAHGQQTAAAAANHGPSALFSPFSPASRPALYPSSSSPYQPQPGTLIPSDLTSAQPSPSRLSLSPAPHSACGPAAKRRRKRAVQCMDREQRLAQHREVDSARRQKEAEAVARLCELVRQHERADAAQQGRHGDERDADEQQRAAMEAEDEEDTAAMEAGRFSKLAVLEASIALIEQLTAERKRVGPCCASAKDAHVSTQRRHSASMSQEAITVVSKHEPKPVQYQPAPPSSAPSAWYAAPDSASDHSNGSTSSFLLSVATRQPTFSQAAHADRSATLHSAGLVSLLATHCVCVVRQGGVILAVNDRFLRCTSWRRCDLLDTLLDVRYASTGRRLSPLMGRLRRHSDQVEPLLQYPAFVLSVEALWRGEIAQARSACRGMRGDGSIMESRTTLWGDYDDQQSGADQAAEGTRLRVPNRIIGVFAMEDAVTVTRAKG